jgi:hypothetical protein
MRRRLAATVLSLAVIPACQTLFAAAKSIPGAEKEAPDQATVIRLLSAAETAYFQAAARYATFSELVQSGQLARTAIQSSAYSHAMQLLNLQSDSQPIPGFVLGLAVTSDGKGYQLSLKVRGESCLPGWFTDQTGILYEGKALDCAVADADAAVAPAPAAPPPARGWSPEDVDAAVPTVSNDSPCPLDQVLHEASLQALQLVDNLQRFSARERIEHIEFGKDGKKHNSSAQSVNYVAEIQQNAQALWVDEYRTGEAESESDQPLLTDTGTAAFALIFHPRLIGNFNIRCEGKADFQGTPAWQLRFEESADPNKSFHQIRIKNSVYQLRFKGRAWIDADSYDVLRLQTDLIAPIPQIDLQVEHLDISYAPVAFEKRKLQIWLPQSASLYIAYHGHRYARLHNFNQFQLFTIATEQTVKPPQASSEASPN